jgi:Uma2 family endonuclease
MVQTPPQPNIQAIALADFLTLPETKPTRQWVDGVILQKPMPQGKHSIVQRELTFRLDRPLRQPQIARAFPELRCTFGERSLVPDITLFRWQRIPRDPSGEVANAFELAPDWTIEILSPDQSQTPLVKNIIHCLKYGCQMGWLIDPSEATVFIYRPGAEVAIFDQAEAILPMPDFASSLPPLTVGELFGWLVE